MIIINVKELINREIGFLENEISENKSEMDNCLPFGREYWKYHDKYQVAYIKKTCLTDLLCLIEESE